MNGNSITDNEGMEREYPVTYPDPVETAPSPDGEDEETGAGDA